MSAEGNPGINQLARTLAGRMREHQNQVETDLASDFGVINGNMSLSTNRFPTPFPPGSYYVCRYAAGMRLVTTDRAAVNLPGLQPGDHVLVVWVANDPVVVDVITR